MDHEPLLRQIYASLTSKHGNSKWTVTVVKEQALGIKSPPPLEATQRFFGHADALEQQGDDKGVSTEVVEKPKIYDVGDVMVVLVGNSSYLSIFSIATAWRETRRPTAARDHNS